ncbi:FAD-dependent oxidoreductase [Niabella terrae]
MDLKSNEPFWLIKNGLIRSYDGLRTDSRCDVLVVGGGITGALIAHQSVADGYRTLLIDKREIANGSTSATTSMLQYEIDQPLIRLTEKIGINGALKSYQACYAAIDQLGALCRQIGSQAGFRKKDSLYFAARKKDANWLQQEFEARQAAGFPVHWLEAAAVRSRYNIQGSYGGILSTQGASVDAFRLVHELLGYNIRKGLQVYDKTELLEVKSRHGFEEVHLGTGAVIQAKKIVYCVGYESRLMIEEPFVDLISTYAMVSEIAPQLCRPFEKLLVWNTRNPYLYMRSTDDHRMLIGGRDLPFRDPVRRDRLIARKSRQLLKDFQQLQPEAAFYPDFTWAGTFGQTRDGLPYIGTHPRFRNAYFVLGFGGNGITFSVTGMEMVASWLKGKRHPLSYWFRFGR